MDGNEVLDENSWFLLFLRQLLMGGEGILETSGLDWMQIVQDSFGASKCFSV